MGTRFRVLPGLLIVALLLGLGACSSDSGSTNSGTGALFVSTQGDSLISNYTIDLSTGLLTSVGSGIATGSVPSTMLFAPSGTALFVANSASNNVATYTVNSNVSLTAGSTSPTGVTPTAMAVDSAGHFLFVANQGSQIDPASGTVSVFAIQNGSLSEVAGSPFRVATPLAPSGPGPSGIAVTPDGKFLYVANQFDGTVSSFSVDATSGALTNGTTRPVGTAPAGMAITPDGGFLYVANSGSSSVSGFAICNQVVSSCGDPNGPDGSLTAVEGSPFSAGIGPTSMAVTLSGKFLFVTDRQSNQVSEFKVATGTGVLTPNTQASIATGLTPSGLSIRQGTTVNSTTLGTTDYLYVTNLGGSTMTVYSFDSTVGVLGLDGPVVITGGQPLAVVTR